MSLLSMFLAAKLYILAFPFALTMTGAGMNQAVLYANGGKFPVMLNERVADRRSHNGYLDDVHCLMTDKTHLNFLADYINLHVVIMSPGDVLIGLGESLAEYAFIVWMTVVVLELNRLSKKQVK